MSWLIQMMLFGGGLMGCTAAKSTVHLVEAEQALYLSRDGGAPEQAIYEYTLAEELVKKAREEWGYSDFGPAETLSREAIEAAHQADKVVQNANRQQVIEDMPSQVPEQAAPAPRDEAPPAIRNSEDKLDLDALDDDEDEE